MKIRLFTRTRDKPVTNRTAGSSYSFLMGGSTSGKNVNERSAMQMTAVYACVRILSEAIAGLPLHLYKYNKDGSKTKAFEHPLYRILHDEPNPEMTSFVFRETLMTHLLLWGNAYFGKTKVKDRRIPVRQLERALWFIPLYNNLRKKDSLGHMTPVAFREANPKGTYPILL